MRSLQGNAGMMAGEARRIESLTKPQLMAHLLGLDCQRYAGSDDLVETLQEDYRSVSAEALKIILSYVLRGVF
jgi:hypothetical protein